MGNEYCLAIKIRLPNSQRVNIANVYLPPTSSLAKRGIAEAHATAQLELALEGIQPQLLTIICGDFFGGQIEFKVIYKACTLLGTVYT
jgi:hypothetical protein